MRKVEKGFKSISSTAMKAEMLASDDLQTVLETRHQQLANRLRQREDHTP